MKIIKTFKTLSIFLILLLVVFLIGYFSIAFYEYDMDVSHWSKQKRAILLLCIVCYLSFTPLIWMKIEEEI